MNEQQVIDFQKKCWEFWDNQNAWCQTSLVDHLFDQEVEGFSHEDIENPYYGDEEEPQKILEWWLVERYLANQLDQHGEPLLRNDYGIWWGRCTSGQPVYMDSVIKYIVRKIERRAIEKR